MEGTEGMIGGALPRIDPPIDEEEGPGRIGARCRGAGGRAECEGGGMVCAGGGAEWE